LATPPPEFVAARNALAKQLRAEKDRESAATVAAIRRPAWPEWALNVTSQAHPDEIEAFARAAGAVREAQEAALEGQPADVRATLDELRQRTAALLTLANGELLAAGRHGDLPELQSNLSEVAGTAEAVERLRGGTLGTGEAGGAPLFAGLPLPAPKPEAVPTATPTDGPARTTRSTDTPAQPAAERRRLMRELATADRDLKRSQRQVRRAEDELAEAEEVATRAAQRLAAARDQLAEATAAAERDTAARDAAAAALDATS
jgi:hypothetical protein